MRWKTRLNKKEGAMPGDGPAVKFSPFEALLIGERNNVIKRKPTKNAVYLTNLNHKRREFNLRELFDVKDERKNRGRGPKKIKRVKRCVEKAPKFDQCKVKVVKQTQRQKKEKRTNKKAQLSKVRFKPEFRFRETLEERIVQKIQKRKKKLKTNLVGNSFLSQLRKPNPNRHSLRGKNGQFIRKDSEKSESGDLSDYVKDACGVKEDDATKADASEDDSNDSDKAKYFTESVLNDISLQYYQNVFPEEFGVSILPNQFEPSDFEQDKDLRGILDESHKDENEEEKKEKEEEDDEESISPGSYIERRRKGLRMYERKRTGKDEVVRFQKNAKENHFVNKGTRSSSLFRNHASTSNKRNGIIDERPAKSNHLIWNNKFRSLFYKTACGSEMYLGNMTKTIVLNSSFGRLPNT